jgi:hypothetical protein
MVTEKIGKAFFWRAGKQPPKSHASFVQFVVDDSSAAAGVLNVVWVEHHPGDLLTPPDH